MQVIMTGKHEHYIETNKRMLITSGPQSVRLKIDCLFLNQNICCGYSKELSQQSRKPVFGVSNKVVFEPACSATETC